MSKTYLRKVHTKKGTSSLLFNIPLDIAEKLDIKAGHYLTVKQEGKKLIISKTKFEEEF